MYKITCSLLRNPQGVIEANTSVSKKEIILNEITGKPRLEQS
jgi:hypothetical protein